MTWLQIHLSKQRVSEGRRCLHLTSCDAFWKSPTAHRPSESLWNLPSVCWNPFLTRDWHSPLATSWCRVFPVSTNHAYFCEDQEERITCYALCWKDWRFCFHKGLGTSTATSYWNNAFTRILCCKLPRPLGRGEDISNKYIIIVLTRSLTHSATLGESLGRLWFFCPILMWHDRYRVNE